MEEEHAGLISEQANDAVVGHVKDDGKFFRRVVPLILACPIFCTSSIVSVAQRLGL